MLYVVNILKAVALVAVMLAGLAIIEDQTALWPVTPANFMVFAFGIAFSHLVDFILEPT